MASHQVKPGRTRKPKCDKGLTYNYCRVTMVGRPARDAAPLLVSTTGRGHCRSVAGTPGSLVQDERSDTRGGDLDSTEIWFRRMRAEDHHPRKSDGNNHNCGHAARSRSVKPCERPPRSACGPGTGCHLSRLVADTWSRMSVTRFSGAGFRRLFAASSRRERDFRSGYAS